MQLFSSGASLGGAIARRNAAHAPTGAVAVRVVWSEAPLGPLGPVLKS